MREGYKIVLTSDRTLMSNYRGSLFIGFTTCGPKTMINPRLFFTFVAPKMETDNGRVKAAPYGLRKIEAALLEYGFTEDDVITVNPDEVQDYIGPETKIVGISAMDPLGQGPATNTFAGSGGLVKVDSYLAWKFKELVENIRKCTADVKIIVGGSGAWQLKNNS
ncbi:MAG: radical SAM protein, partial [Candidatus Odinarchaeota archaeon]